MCNTYIQVKENCFITYCRSFKGDDKISFKGDDDKIPRKHK